MNKTLSELQTWSNKEHSRTAMKQILLEGNRSQIQIHVLSLNLFYNNNSNHSSLTATPQ